MDEVLYRAGDPWRDLLSPMLSHLAAGRAVVWVSFSGTLQTFASSDGDVTRIRCARANHHPGDGLPILFEQPFFATACGCGDREGYRSTVPLLVAAVRSVHDVEPVVEYAMQLGRQLADRGAAADVTPADHPANPCSALYCVVKAEGPVTRPMAR